MTTLALADIEAAAATLDGVAVSTPVLHCDELDRRTGAEVMIKAEALQRSGSFKFRGAYTKLARLVEAGAPTGGVVAVSSGNHAAAVAVAAQLLGLAATVFMPTDAPEAKRRIAARAGADIHTFERSVPDREAAARAFAIEHDAAFVHPYEDRDVQAGQGTVALELFDAVGSLDVLLVPMSGGGLMAGCGSVAVARAPECARVGVEPAVGDDWRRSLDAGRRIRIPPPDTVADGLALVIPGEATWEINRHLVDEVLTVGESEILAAATFCHDELKVVTEPSGAVGIAALLGAEGRFAGRRVGVVLTGGNLDRG